MGRDIEADPAYRDRIEPFTRERLLDIHIKYHETVSDPPRFVKADRKFHCGDKKCDFRSKVLDELERHYAEAHAG